MRARIGGGVIVMSRALAIVFLGAVLSLVQGAAAAAEGVQILLLETPQTAPSVAAVQGLAEEQLESFHVWVELQEREAWPGDAAEWGSVARDAARRRPGTLALFGWQCTGRRCRLIVVETRSAAVVELAIAAGEDDAATAQKLAGAIREAVLGTLLPELERLGREGQQPSAPSDIFGAAPGQEPPSAESVARPWLWLEGGYHGEYPYPGERALHGPWLAASAAPARYLLAQLGVGWLGVQHVEVTAGEVTTHRLPIQVGLGLRIPVGQATAALLPAARVDVVFAQREVVGPPAERATATDPELHLGGVAGWRLPLARRLEITLGIGAFGTVISRAYAIGAVEALERSRLRIVWSVGVAWSPLG